MSTNAGPVDSAKITLFGARQIWLKKKKSSAIGRGSNRRHSLLSLVRPNSIAWVPSRVLSSSGDYLPVWIQFLQRKSQTQWTCRQMLVQGTVQGWSCFGPANLTEKVLQFLRIFHGSFPWHPARLVSSLTPESALRASVATLADSVGSEVLLNDDFCYRCFQKRINDFAAVASRNGSLISACRRGSNRRHSLFALVCPNSIAWVPSWVLSSSGDHLLVRTQSLQRKSQTQSTCRQTLDQWLVQRWPCFPQANLTEKVL